MRSLVTGMAIGREAPSRLISQGRRGDDNGLAIRGLALIRFDFVLHEHRDELIEWLEEAFGAAQTASREDETSSDVGEHSIFTGDPSRLGFDDGFNSLSLHILEPTEHVTEIRTLVTATPQSTCRRLPQRRADWQEWEQNLGTVRRFIPGEARGPETTVWWIDVEHLPEAFEEVRGDAAEHAGSMSGNRELQQVIEITTERGSVLLDDTAILVPGATDPSVGRLTGRLIALDLVDGIGSAVESGGLEIPGSWSALSALLAIEYWAHAMATEIEAFEGRLDAAVSDIERDASDIGRTREMVSELFEIEADWAGLESRFERELRGYRRRLHGVETGATDSPELGGFPGGIRDRSGGVLDGYLDRLDSELAATRDDADRVGERLASVARLLGTRASLLAARQNLALQEAIPRRTEVAHSRDSMSPWIVPIVVLIGIVIAADALMSGGLERFVDRLFDEGLAAFTPQVLTGLAVVMLAILVVLATRHRASIVELVYGRK